MSYLISAVKRKFESLTSFISGREKDEDTMTTDDDLESSRPAKRKRLNGSSTPMLHYSDTTPEESPNLIVESSIAISTTPTDISPKKSETIENGGSGTIHQPSDMLRLLPPHVLSKCLSFLSTRSERYALQTACTLFRRLSNEDHMLASVDVGGRWPANYSFSHVAQDNDDGIAVGAARRRRQRNRGALATALLARGEDVDIDDIEGEERYVLERISDRSETGTGGILSESDTTISACRKLIKFASAGNMQAIYM